METLDSLIAEYTDKRTNLSQRELATYERSIWALHGVSNPGRRGLLRDWFSKKFGGTVREYESRQTLMSAGQNAELLWDRINKGMSPITAVRLLRESKKTDKTVVELLNEYDNLSQEVTLTNGTVIRRREPIMRRIPVQQVSQSIRDFKIHIRQVVNDFKDPNLEGADEYQVKAAKEELLEWIDEALDNFHRHVNRLRDNTLDEKLYVKIGKTRFSSAIEILGLKQSEFVFSKPIPFKKVRKAYVERVKLLHPDRNHGNEAMVREYQAVVEAFDVLNTYKETIGVTNGH